MIHISPFVLSASSQLSCELLEFQPATFTSAASLVPSNYSTVTPLHPCRVVPGKSHRDSPAKIILNFSSKLAYQKEYKLVVSGLHTPFTLNTQVHAKLQISIKDFLVSSDHLAYNLREPYTPVTSRFAKFTKSVFLFEQFFPNIFVMNSTDQSPLTASYSSTSNISPVAGTPFSLDVEFDTSLLGADLVADHHFFVVKYPSVLGSASDLTLSAANSTNFELVPLSGKADLVDNYYDFFNKKSVTFASANFDANFSENGEMPAALTSLVESLKNEQVSDYDTSKGANVNSTDSVVSDPEHEVVVVRLLSDISVSSGTLTLPIENFKKMYSESALASKTMDIYINSPSRKLHKIEHTINMTATTLAFTSSSFATDITAFNIVTELQVSFTLNTDIIPGNIIEVSLSSGASFLKEVLDNNDTLGSTHLTPVPDFSLKTLLLESPNSLILSDNLSLVVSPDSSKLALKFLKSSAASTSHSFSFKFVKTDAASTSLTVGLRVLKSSSDFPSHFAGATKHVLLTQTATRVFDYSAADSGIPKLAVHPVMLSYSLQSQDFGPLRFSHTVTTPLNGSLHNIKVFTFSIFSTSYTQDVFCSLNHRVPLSCSFHFEANDPSLGFYLFVLDDDFAVPVGETVVFEIYPMRQEISFLRKNFFIFPSSGDHPLRVDLVDKADALVSSQDFILNVKPARMANVDSRVLTYEPGEKNILKLRLRNWLPINTVSKGRYLLSFIIKDRNANISFSNDLNILNAIHNGTCRGTFDRQDTIFTHDHELYSSLTPGEISKGAIDFDCFFFEGHSAHHTENVNLVFEPKRPTLPFSQMSIVVNQLGNPGTDSMEAFLEIKSQNFDEVNREWVTNHFQSELLFIAQTRQSPRADFNRELPMVLGTKE